MGKNIVFNLRYTGKSNSDLDQIAAYLAERSAHASLSVLSEIRGTINRLLDFPYVWPVYLHNPRYRRAVVGSYLVFYEINEVDEEKKLIYVARVLHSSQNIESIMGSR